ncbi:Sec-independent protein translocase protein TatB [Rhodovulum sp. DZ06]|uniref:Sec-independent protein translocase protein TatB n=1 Tax=Rhodovulum sp. DZ06 TaxID=3425126 RepID=UPI003D34295F
MLDIGWSELLVIGGLALIVVPPKDLPGMMRNVGRFVAKARGMAREFQGAMEDAARQADLGDVADLKKDVSKWSSNFGASGPKSMAKSLLDDDKPAAAPAKGSYDEADAAENAAWEVEQAAKAAAEAAKAQGEKTRTAAERAAAAEEEARAAALRAAEAKAEAEAERLSAVNRSAEELEAELARDEAKSKPSASS